MPLVSLECNDEAEIERFLSNCTQNSPSYSRKRRSTLVHFSEDREDAWEETMRTRRYGYGYCSHASCQVQYLWREVYLRLFVVLTIIVSMNLFAYVISISEGIQIGSASLFDSSGIYSRLVVPIKRDGTLGMAGSRVVCHCSFRGTTWRLCKCCSWRRNRCSRRLSHLRSLLYRVGIRLHPNPNITPSAATLRRILFRSSNEIP